MDDGHLAPDFMSESWTSPSRFDARDRRAIPPISRWTFVVLVTIVDVASVVFLSYFSLILSQHRFFDIQPGTGVSLVAAISISVIAVAIFRWCGVYRFETLLRGGFSALAGAAAWTVATSLLVVFTLLHDPHGEYTRVWILIWFVMGAAAIALERTLVAAIGRLLLRQGILGHVVCVVGSGQFAAACVEAAKRDRSELVFLGYLDHAAEGGITSVPRWLGRPDRLPDLVRSGRVDEVIIPNSIQRQDQLREFVESARRFPVKISLGFLTSDLSLGLDAGSRTLRHRDNLTLIPLIDPPLSGWSWILKDVLDRAMALVATVFFAPVMLLIAIAIRLSGPGPILFHQVRVGYGGREFRMFKFRTMHASASAPTGKLTLTRRDDPRIFPFGRFLRRTSLDELPQLFNVLLGDMWLVGPRPHSPLASAAEILYCDAVLEYAGRHRIKPGITGWAQVNGWRGPTETVEQIRQRVTHDLHYIENYSMLLDVRILVRTVFGGAVHPNAF
jgi:Undecaprenyl-phosphate glucose phosphotransferase